MESDLLWLWSQIFGAMELDSYSYGVRPLWLGSQTFIAMESDLCSKGARS